MGSCNNALYCISNTNWTVSIFSTVAWPCIWIHINTVIHVRFNITHWRLSSSERGILYAPQPQCYCFSVLTGCSVDIFGDLIVRLLTHLFTRPWKLTVFTPTIAIKIMHQSLNWSSSWNNSYFYTWTFPVHLFGPNIEFVLSQQHSHWCRFFSPFPFFVIKLEHSVQYV